jgi:putative DNA primase/helicase
MGIHLAPELRASSDDHVADEDSERIYSAPLGTKVIQMPEPEARAAAFNPLTDAGNAELFVELYGDDVRFDHGRGCWYVWDKHRWRPDLDGDVFRKALAAVRLRFAVAMSDDLGLKPETREGLAKHAIRSEQVPRLEALLKAASRMQPISDSGRGWDETPGLVCCENGVVDLRTGELRPGRPEDKITKQIPIAYDSEAECPRFRSALREWVDTGDPEETEQIVRYVRRAMGYGLTGEASLELLLFLMGGGSNGKSTFLEIYREACGEYAVEVEPTVLKRTNYDRHSTEVADLAGARMVTCEELGDETLNTDRIKHITGGTRVRARRVRENSTEFRQTWLLWLTSNGQPKADDSSWGFWRRVRVIDFPHTFAQDETLKSQLLEELPGIFTGIVQGAVEFYAGGLGEVPESIAEHTGEYREAVDPLEALFSGGVLVEQEGAFTSSEMAYKAYVWWADKIGQPYKLGLDSFTKALAARPGLKRSRARIDGEQVRGFLGLAIGPSVPREDAERPSEGGSETPKTASESSSTLADQVWPD